MWEQILTIIDHLAPSLLTLLGVWLGWGLNSHSQKKQNRLDRLADSFDALREIRHIAENIPPDLTIEELQGRLTENDFRRNLSGRLVPLFGLRTELIPHLDSDIVDFIDNQLYPLYKIEMGTYELREECIEQFANSCFQLKDISHRVEIKLSNEYEKLRK